MYISLNLSVSDFPPKIINIFLLSSHMIEWPDLFLGKLTLVSFEYFSSGNTFSKKYLSAF